MVFKYLDTRLHHSGSICNGKFNVTPFYFNSQPVEMLINNM